jgi:hypothetical protein
MKAESRTQPTVALTACGKAGLPPRLVRHNPERAGSHSPDHHSSDHCVFSVQAHNPELLADFRVIQAVSKRFKPKKKKNFTLKPHKYMSRNGKNTRLPSHVCEELNFRLERAQRGPSLLVWLNALPDVREMRPATLIPTAQIKLRHTKSQRVAVKNILKRFDHQHIPVRISARISAISLFSKHLRLVPPKHSSDGGRRRSPGEVAFSSIPLAPCARTQSVCQRGFRLVYFWA